jgi:hypothetical protein
MLGGQPVYGRKQCYGNFRRLEGNPFIDGTTFMDSNTFLAIVDTVGEGNPFMDENPFMVFRHQVRSTETFQKPENGSAI